MTERDRTRRVRAQFEAAREALGQLNAFAELLQSATPRSSSARARSSSARSSSRSEPGVIELVEVRPGVFAAPVPTDGPSLCGGLGRADEFGLGDLGDVFERFERVLGKDAPWRKNRPR
jgi:hypothetical protein